jgi:hypothetical protein
VKEKKIRWVEKIKYEMKKSEIEGSKVVVIWKGDNLCGVIGMMKWIKKENGGRNVRCVFMKDEKIKEF